MSGQLRNVVIAVAALFVANFCYDEYLFRAATHDVIVETFRATAAQACHSNAMTQKIEASEILLAESGISQAGYRQEQSGRLFLAD